MLQCLIVANKKFTLIFVNLINFKKSENNNNNNTMLQYTKKLNTTN